jgi:phosphocarrier protein
MKAMDESTNRAAGQNSADSMAAEPVTTDPVVRTFLICNKKGLHARASAKFVQTVEKFDADVRVTRGHETVGGTSIMGLMMLAAAPGTSITVNATGREATAVIDALEALITSRFGESD